VSSLDHPLPKQDQVFSTSVYVKQQNGLVKVNQNSNGFNATSRFNVLQIQTSNSAINLDVRSYVDRVVTRWDLLRGFTPPRRV